ncbi:hypothetical protein CsSME_00008784 [Camellia sinensis var. sinensis]
MHVGGKVCNHSITVLIDSGSTLIFLIQGLLRRRLFPFKATPNLK